jgi:hypothetical protein
VRDAVVGAVTAEGDGGVLKKPDKNDEWAGEENDGQDDDQDNFECVWDG